ncbi:MAG: DegT/DnrJ/EryC1/StrS family aminotransferase [Planctomycetes bacterium]|nr:DegT/DnrJ/EryC1/StrS family aminotransferase [Planctomycetota bacterium]
MSKPSTVVRPVRSKERFLVFGRPTIEDAEIAEVVDSLKKCWLGTGPKVARFEREFAAYAGAPHSVAMHSCTAALHLSILAAGLKPGDEVITTPLTFCATVNAILHAGATPVLADVDRKTMNLDPERVEAALTPRTRAILPVHFAGRPCDMDALTDLARRKQLVMIEDCAHAIETRYKGKQAGLFGDFGCFSFYATKNITTGEGGMVLTKDESKAAQLKMLALHGMSKDAWKRFSDDGYKHYSVVELGFKYNMMDLQAAIGLHQLPRIEQWHARRAEVWQAYDRAFASLPVERPAPPEPDTRHALHLYTLLVDEGRARLTRDEFLSAMTAHNIGVGVHYLSVPEHPFYQRTFGWKPEHFPNAMEIGRRTVSIPLSAGLSDEDVADVITAVKSVL